METSSPSAASTASTTARPSTASPRTGSVSFVVGTLGGIVLGAVLLVAAWSKILDPTAFAAEITRQGLDFLLPASAVAMIALALEVGLGTALVLGIRRLGVLVPAALLTVFFLFLTGRTYLASLRGETVEAGCGCFGNLVERTPAEAFWGDLLLLGVPLALAFVGRRRGPFPGARIAVVLVVTLAALVVAWKAPELPLDDLATRLRPGVAVSELCFGEAEARECLDSARILPEVADGEHLVVIADLEDEEMVAATEDLNLLHEASYDGTSPPVWMLTDAAEDVLFKYRFTGGPIFEVREAPPALLSPLYRTRPRSFRVRDGVVEETWAGLPP